MLRTSVMVAGAVVLALLAGCGGADEPGIDPVPAEENDYADVRLDADAERALRVVVDGYVAMVLAELKRARFDEPAFAVCLYAGQEELDITPLVAVGLASDRKRLFDPERDGGWESIWNPFEYGEEGDFLNPEPPDPPKEVLEAWARLRKALADRVLDPTLWTLVRIAHRLNRIDLPLPLTEDGVVYALDESFGDGLIHGIRFAARPETFNLLRQRGYIGELEEEGSASASASEQRPSVTASLTARPVR